MRNRRRLRWVMTTFVAHYRSLSVLFGLLNVTPAVAQIINWEAEPISYSHREVTENSVAGLQTDLESGERVLQGRSDRELLHALLHELEVPVTSQVLVFSRTSLQKPQISMETPRAIYFNDDVFVSYVQQGLIEIAVSDPDVGMAFYTIDPKAETQLRLQRQANRCLSCHGGSLTKGKPGLIVRSVFPNSKSEPVIRAGSMLTTPSSPLSQRWGGWYVTGQHGSQHHLGNYVLQEKRRPETIDNSAGENRTTLPDVVDSSLYLAETSDIVALMVMEHQVDVYNKLTHANFTVQSIEFKSAGPTLNESEISQIRDAVQPLAESLCFADEIELSEPIQGDPGFCSEFESRRSDAIDAKDLRKFDLQTRMFRSPISYLIRSKTFAALSPTLQRAIAKGIRDHLRSTAEMEETWLHLMPEWFHDVPTD